MLQRIYFIECCCKKKRDNGRKKNKSIYANMKNTIQHIYIQHTYILWCVVHFTLLCSLLQKKKKKICKECYIVYNQQYSNILQEENVK